MKVKNLFNFKTLKFRAALKTKKESILVEPCSILKEGYYINIDDAQRAYQKKYPEKGSAAFWDFIEEIEKQEHIQEISSDCDLIIVKDHTNLMQATGIFDATKFKELPSEIQEEWLKNHTKEEWPGFEIYEGDVTALRYDKQRTEFGVVSYSTHGAGFSKNGTALSSYQKLTKIVGNLIEGYPDEAKYSVNFYLEN